MKKIVVVSLIALLTSCSAKLFVPNDADVSRVAVKYPGTTLADLNKGKALYQTKCTQCHGAKKPTSKTAEEWNKLVPEMAGKAKKKGKELITGEDQDLILKYLTAAISR